MLTNELVAQIWPLAHKLAKKNITLIPVKDTFLSTIVQDAASRYTAESMINSIYSDFKNDENFFIDSIVKSSNSVNELIPSVQQLVSQEVLNQIENKLKQDHDVIKNQITPMIKRIVNKIYLHSSEKDKNNDILSYNRIEFFNYDHYLDCTHLQELTSIYNGLEPKGIKLNLPAIKAPNDILEYIKTGQFYFDKHIETLLPKGYEEAVLLGIWNQFFGHDFGSKNLVDILTFDQETIHTAIIGFTMVMAIRQNPPTNINMNLDDFNVYFSNLQAEIGRIISRWYSQRENDFKNKKIWFKTDLKTNKIFINDSVYSLFIDQGGSLDLIFGCLLANKNIEYNDLLENKDYYEKIYAANREILNKSKQEKSYIDLVESLRTVVTEEINSLPMDLDFDNKSVMHQNLNEEIARIEKRYYYEIYDLVKNIVCRVIFSQHRYEKFLDYFEDCSEAISSNANTELETREVALTTSIVYLTDSLLTYIGLQTQ